MVSPPTRPMNISAIRTAREIWPSWGVTPRVRPTVPTAEAVSYRQVEKGSPSAVLMTTAPRKNRLR